MALYNGHKGNKHVRLSQRASHCYVVSYRLGDSGTFRELMITDDMGMAYAYYNELLA